MSAPELLPCPFCGGSNLETAYPSNAADCGVIACRTCGAEGPDAGPDEYVNDWNRRTAPVQHAPSGWQDIASAPRDGTEILGAVGMIYQGGVVVVQWAKELGAWIDWDMDFWQPTHWMPLPATPAQDIALATQQPTPPYLERPRHDRQDTRWSRSKR